MNGPKLTRPPLERMLRIHDALKRGGPVTCTTLQKALEMSRKTPLRDIRYMRERLHLPVDFDRTRNTYHYQAEVKSFPTMQVTEGELVAVCIGQKAVEQYRGTSFHRELCAAFEKMTSGMRDMVSFEGSEEMEAISFKNCGVGKTDVALFNALSRALVGEREVEFDYRKPGATQTIRRQVQPYHLSSRQNLWYLVGYDKLRSALRTFALPRITNALVTKTRFKRAADFSAEKFFANALSVFGGDGNHRIVIRFSATAADHVRVREWHESQELHELPDGSLELELRLGALPEVERWVLSWGAEARVLHPPELRQRIARAVAALAEEYRGDATAPSANGTMAPTDGSGPDGRG